MTTGLPIALCAAALTGLLVAERAAWRPGIWLTKPVAAGAFVWAAVVWGALGSTYGRWILLGLILSLLGDVLLIPRDRPGWFRTGIVAFLGGHLAYIVAFSRLPRSGTGLVTGLLVATGLAAAVARWLGGRLPTGYRRLVAVYVLVICTMLVAAFAAAAGTGLWSLALGAALFAVSDLSVARDRFVQRSFVNRLWGLPLYFAAQLVLASTVAA